MADSHDFDQTSDSTLTKLLEVDSELAVQERELLSQLESIQEKRKSLKTVVSLFTEVDTPATAQIEELAQIPPAETNEELETDGDDSVEPPLETSRATTTAELQIEAASNIQPNGTKSTSSSPMRGNKSTKATRPTKTAIRSLGWQDYLRETFSNASLPEAVASVLQRQANEVLEIPTIVNTIFVDELPKEVGYKARRQVTNILSDGARKNKWYRGQIGYYSMSKAAAQANFSASMRSRR